jgi:hypothetical protein
MQLLRQTNPTTPDLSVIFVGLTNGPVRQMTPTSIEVASSATGLCALFWVTNVGTRADLRFRTTSIEQRTRQGWERFVVSKAWSGVGGSLWTPGYGCLFAIAWPPGMSTNATWRLQLSCQREPTGLRGRINDELGWEAFHAGQDRFISSSAVHH